MKRIMMCLVMSVSLIQGAEAFHRTPVLERRLEKHVGCGEITPEGAEIIIRVLQRRGAIKKTDEQLAMEVYAEAAREGVQVEGDNKIGIGTALKIIIRGMRPATVHAATHDGRGNCNAGCGRPRFGNH